MSNNVNTEIHERNYEILDEHFGCVPDKLYDDYEKFFNLNPENFDIQRYIKEIERDRDMMYEIMRHVYVLYKA